MLDNPVPDTALDVLQKEKAWRRAIHRAQTKYNKHISDLRNATKAQDQIEAEKLIEWLLSAKSSKIVAVAQLLRAGKALDVLSYEDALVLAGNVTPLEPMDEPALIYAKEKTSKNGYRTIFSFGDRHRVAHRMLANVIEAQTVTRKFQFFDEGVQKAIVRILSQIGQGYVWLAHLDIKDFYPSFTKEGLTKFLPLPGAAVEAALTGQKMVLKCGALPSFYPHTSSHLIKVARRGLPQGAASSPAVSHLCVSRLVVDECDLEHVFNYEDDFLLLAKTKDELEERIKRLVAAVGSLPGGHFSTSLKAMSHAEVGLDFLGHRIKQRDCTAVAEPSEENFLRLISRLHEVEDSSGIYVPFVATDQTNLLQASADRLAVLQGWMSAFDVCDKNCEIWRYSECLLDDIVSEVEKNECSLSNLPKSTAKASMKPRRYFYYRWFG